MTIMFRSGQASYKDVVRGNIYHNMSLFIKTNTRKIGYFEFRKSGVFKSISELLSISKKFIFMDILAPKVTVHDVKSGL